MQTWKEVWNSLDTPYSRVIKRAIEESFTTDKQVILMLNTDTLELTITHRAHGEFIPWTGGKLIEVGGFDRDPEEYDCNTWQEILNGDMRQITQELEDTLWNMRVDES